MTSPPSEQTPAQVTQADRDALVALDDALGFMTDIERPIALQFLASHREAAERRVVEWLRSLNEGGHEGWQPDYLAEMIERGEHIQENSNGK